MSRHIKKGILVETGERGCKNGFTVVYRIDLAKVKALELTGEPNTKTGARVAGVPGPQWTPNHSKTIQKPPMRACAATANEEAEKVLAAYPPDRVRGKADSLRRIREALETRTKFEDMLQAVKIYATESEGFTWSKVCFSDNWFKSKRWRAYVEEIGNYSGTLAPIKWRRFSFFINSL